MNGKMKWSKIKELDIYISDGNYSSKYPRASEFTSNGIPFIRANNLVNRTISSDDMYFISEEKHKVLAKGHIKTNDILITTRGNLGTVALVPENYEDANINAQIVLLRANPEQISPNFLVWCFSIPEVQNQISQLQTGTALKQLPVGKLTEIEIPLPPIAEQKRIAAILDKADAIRRKRQEAIKLTEELGRSLFLDMFGDLTKFQKIKIEKVASKEKHALSSGPFGSNLTSKDYVDYGVLVLRGKNITQGELDLSDSKYISHGKANSLSRSIVKSGDIVVVAVGSSGFSFTIPEGFPKAVMSQNFNKITPDINKINPVYFSFILNSCFVQNQLKQNITDTVRTFLSLTKLKRIEIPLPDINLQNSFAKKIAAINKLKKIEERNLQESENLFNSLLQRAFKGEL